MALNKWDVDLVGVLASDDFVSEKIGKPSPSVFINRQNSLQFSIRLVSQLPDGLPSIELFTGYPQVLDSYGFEDLYVDEGKRRESLQEFLMDKLLVFRPIRKFKSGGEVHYQMSDVRLHPKPSGYFEGTTFIPVPIFSEKKHGYTYEEFLDKLWNNRFVGRIEKFSTEPNDTPSYVLWRDEENDSFVVVGEFERHRYAHGGFSFLFQELKENRFQEEWFEYVVEDGDVLFMSHETYVAMEEMMRATAPLERVYAEELRVEQPVVDVRAALVPHAAAQAADGRAEAAATATAVKEETARLAEEKAETKSEEAFLDHFMHVAMERSLLYDERDLINFHTAMKSSTLVILAGMSGTGKSKLVEVYGKALGLDESSQVKIIPVRPSWTDDADLIGYVDSIHNVYRPGDSGLIDTLIEAENNPNKLYIVCFDEMNLARVEHYFSQFLSVLEMTPYSRRLLRLYNDDLEARLYNAARYTPTVKIGENVMFVGTVNLDESTYHFSDKVLDRANVISLRVLPFRQLKNLKEMKAERKDWQPKKFSLEDFREFRNHAEALQLFDREIDFLEALHEAIQAVNSKQGIGHRIVRQIDLYMKNLPERAALTRAEAFDLQIVQRILTKLRGPEDQLRTLVGTMNHDGELEGSRLLELMNQFADISAFVEARKVVAQKAKELRLHGYTV
jgi:hypothetical protein